MCSVYKYFIIGIVDYAVGVVFCVAMHGLTCLKQRQSSSSVPTFLHYHMALISRKVNTIYDVEHQGDL